MPKHSPRLRAFSVFNQLKFEYDKLNQRRKFFYETASVDTLFQANDLSYREVEDVSKCLFELYDTDPKLIFDFVVKNSSFASLPSTETFKIASYFLPHLHTLEAAYLTWRYKNDREKCILVLPNRMFLEMTNIDSYFGSKNNTQCSEDSSKAIRFFILQFERLIDLVNTDLANLNPAYDEIVFLVCLLIYDPEIPDISTATQTVLLDLRNSLIRDFSSMYNTKSVNPRTRLNVMMTVASNIKSSTGKYKNA